MNRAEYVRYSTTSRGDIHIVPAIVMMGLAIVVTVVVLFATTGAFDDYPYLFLLPWIFGLAVVMAVPLFILHHQGRFSLADPIVFATLSYFFPAFVVGGFLLAGGWSQPGFLSLIQDIQYVLCFARDITENKKALLALKQSEEKLLKIFHLSPDVILLSRVSDGLIIDVNERVVELGGYSRSEIIGMTTIQLLGWTGLEERDGYLTALAKHGHVQGYAKTLKTKSGAVKYTTISGELLELNGEKFILTVIHDITRQEIATQKIIESERKYLELFEKTPMPLFLYEVNSLDIIDVNQTAIAHYGFSKHEFLKMKITDLRTKEEAEKLLNYLKNRNARGFYKAGIWEHKKKDGQLISVEVTSHEFDYGKNQCRLSLVNDVSEKLLAQKKLAESEAEYRNMIELNEAGIYQVSIKGELLNFNNAFAKMLGYHSKEELLLEKENLFNFRHTNRDEFINMLTKDGKLNHYEIQLKQRTGQLVDAVENCFFRKDSNGQLLIEGTMIEITALKKAELALQKSLKETTDYKYALDQSSIISITDSNGVITYVNDNFCRIYHLTNAEAVGQSHNAIVNSGYHPASFWKQFWKTIRSGKVLKVEVCNKDRKGNFHWQDTTIIPFIDKDGSPYQYLAIRTDITEKRKLEIEMAAEQLNHQKTITEITIQTQEKERNELGRELHDNINQILASVKMFLGLARTKEVIPLDLIEQSYKHLGMAMDEIRKLSHSLVIPSLGDICLKEALEDLVKTLTVTRELKIKLVTDLNDQKLLDENRKLMLYRIVQEQMNNILKYAKAQVAVIHLQLRHKKIELSISDDGEGFEMSKKSKGIGLRNIQNRVEFYSGTMKITSAPGEGCSLEVSIPI